MGFWDTLLGMDSMMNDQDIADDMLKDSKFAVISLAKAATTGHHPQLKELFEAELLLAVQNHHKLADLASTKEWYKPRLSPMEQIIEDLEASQDISTL